MTVVEEIQKLKQEKNAVILAHYYVRPEIQDIADYIGDSFIWVRLQWIERADHRILWRVFHGRECEGTEPGENSSDAGYACRLCNGTYADAKTIQKMRDTYEDLAVVCYINSTAELKTHSDVCVTSANAVKIVKALPNKNIFLFRTRTWHILLQSRYRKRILYTTRDTVRFTNTCRLRRSKQRKHSTRQQRYWRIRNVQRQCLQFPIM